MKRHNNLYNKVTSFENLLIASKKALKGTTSKKESLKYFFHLEPNILKLQQKLENLSYIPGKYKYFRIYEPKEREIAVAPFIDRVVHHAIINVLEPIYEKIFIYDSYATRKEKGTHKAIFRAQNYIRKNKWYFKTDIKKYFDNINHNILINIIKRKIKDKKLILLMEKIVRNGGINGIGLPIGNLTSQFLANVYLDKLDHYIKEELQIKYYIRYMDDFVIFDNNKGNLKTIRSKVDYFINKELNLQLKEKATFINRQLNGLSFLGKRVFPNTIRIKNDNLKRSLKKIEQNENNYEKGRIDITKLYNSTNSIIGYIKNFNTMNLRNSIIRNS